MKFQSQKQPQAEKTLQNKAKKLYVITKSNWGGAQKYVFDKAKADLEKGCDVSVATGGPGEMTEQLNTIGISTFFIPSLTRDMTTKKDMRLSSELMTVYETVRPEIVHLNSSKIGGIGSQAARLYNLKHRKQKMKIIFTAHGWAFNEDRPWWQKLLIKIASYMTILYSHKTIVLSQKEYDQVASWPFIKDKLEIQNLEIGEIYFQEKKDARKFLLNKTSLKNDGMRSAENKFWIGTIAELHKNKGLSFGISAIRKIKESNTSSFEKIRWFIIGEGEERATLEKQIAESGLDKNIFLLGNIPEAAQFLKAFNLFMLPSIKEGLPYVLLEAEKADLPILSTDVGGIKERFNKKPNKIIAAGNSDELSDSLLSYL